MLFMKKLLKGCFLAFAAVVLGFTACTEPVEVPPAQVYFSKDNDGRVDIAIDANSFDVTLNRLDADGSALVPITVTADSLAAAWFELPGTVEFTDTALSAVYTITVKDGAVLEYDKYAGISLAVAGENAAALGKTVHSFEVGVPAPWSEWEKVGEGTYYPSVYWSGEQESLSLYYRECLVNDADAQYCIQGIGNTMNLTVEFDRQGGACQVLPQYAATNYKYGQVTVSDVPHSPLSAVEGTYEEYPCTYDAERGLFTFNLAYIVSTQWGGNADESFGCGIEKFQLDGFVKLDADYSFAMQFRGHYIDADGVDNAVISVSKGADVGGCLMAVVAADNNTDAVVQGMLAGNVPCDTLIAGGFYACPMSASGNYKAVAITYNADGEVIEPHTVEFEFWVAADSNPWTSLGYAKYTDDVVAPLLGATVPAYYVQVLESKEQPGLFRLLDPYGPAFPMYQSAESYKDGSYIEIDATDPQGVWIVGWQSTGFNILDKGLVSITSDAWYQANALGATKEEVKEAGFCGTYANGVITFPVNGILWSVGDQAFYGNTSGEFALDITNLLESIPAEEGAESATPVVRMGMKPQGKAVGKVSLFKRIDNSFLTPQQ